MRTMDKPKAKHAANKTPARHRAPGAAQQRAHREQEDRHDLAAAKKALSDSTRIPYDEVRKELGLA